MIQLPLSNIETMTLEHMWNYKNLIEQVLEFLNELAEIKKDNKESKNPQNLFLSTHSKPSENTAKRPNQNVSPSINHFPKQIALIIPLPHLYIHCQNKPSGIFTFDSGSRNVPHNSTHVH